MKDSTIITMELPVWAAYICSKCGKENELEDLATVTASAATLMELKKLEGDLRPVLYPRGLSRAGLSCRCGCGHRESWARMDFRQADRAVKALLIAALVCAAVLYLLHTVPGVPVLLLLAVGGAALLGAAVIAAVKAAAIRKLEAETAALPRSALPRLRLRK